MDGNAFHGLDENSFDRVGSDSARDTRSQNQRKAPVDMENDIVGNLGSDCS